MPAAVKAAARLAATTPTDLIPGLPNSVVLDCLIPRIPWHTRPLLTAVSKAWQKVMQEPSKYSSLTREAMCANETTWGGLVMVHQLSQEATEDYFKQVKVRKWMPPPHCLSMFDEAAQQWRRIPPIPAVAPLPVLHDCGIASLGRKLFVMGGWDPKTNAVSAEVFELDLGSGLWQWRKRKSMHTSKSLFFCKAVAGKIYVVGGASSHNHREEEPLPEVYDAGRDEWEVLPRVTLSRSFKYNGLAVTGHQVVAFGFRSLDLSKPGDLVNFWRLYDPVAKQWEDWDCVDHGCPCSNLLTGEHDLRDGFVNALDRCSKRWRRLDGRICSKAWRWEGGCRIAVDSCCAHNFLAVICKQRPHVYATICEGEGEGESESRSLSIWRGDLDYSGSRVLWCQ
eukprot:c40912_g1_i1 orf=3-1181(-)